MSAFTDHFIKKGALFPVLDATLTSGGVAMNLNGKTVSFRMRNQDTRQAKALSGSCAVTDADNGRVRFTWASGDTDTEGTFEGEFVVTTGGSTPDIAPDNGFLVVRITATAT